MKNVVNNQYVLHKWNIKNREKRAHDGKEEAYTDTITKSKLAQKQAQNSPINLNHLHPFTTTNTSEATLYCRFTDATRGFLSDPMSSQLYEIYRPILSYITSVTMADITSIHLLGAHYLAFSGLIA